MSKMFILSLLFLIGGGVGLICLSWNTDKPLPPRGENFREALTGIEFVWVPEGCFAMGDVFQEGLPDELPVHEVCLDGFWMGQFEVTQHQWETIMGENPAQGHLGENYPVDSISWRDARAFVRQLNIRYQIETFALPTEAQWEYACRGGGKPVRFGNQTNVADPTTMNFEASLPFQTAYSQVGETRGATVPVGSFSSQCVSTF